MKKELKEIIINSGGSEDDSENAQRIFKVVKNIDDDKHLVVCDRCGSKECEFFIEQQKIYCPKCVSLEIFD